MPMERVCKTIHQYNKEPIKEADMQKLLEIAGDYRKVKNYVYSRYGGIASLSKIYPGYTVQNEMTDSGYREILGMPSVYFYLAIFDALGDIKSQWTRTKTKISKLTNQNEGFTEADKHYLRFLLKVSNAFEEVLNQKPVELPDTVQKQYGKVAAKVDTEKLNKYLCRQVRKHHVKLHTDRADGFAIAERAYRYADHGIYISIKEKRKRVFVLLTDNNRYKSQLYIKLYPKEHSIRIKAPVNVTVRDHADYRNQVGVSTGVYTMLTTDKGHRYGSELGRYQIEYADWIREQTRIYNCNRSENPGRKKYRAKKKRMEEQLHSYINKELNRFLREEKPKTIYIVKLPKPQAGGVNKKINHSMAQWQRGYIRKRMLQKCMEQAVEVVEVLGKDISNECSSCGAIGKKEKGEFICPQCGYQSEEKINTARNVKKRGQGDGALNRGGTYS
ncbi:MAG: transposase [Dorea sp.]|nr:transposase [Dorea sp.]